MEVGARRHGRHQPAGQLRRRHRRGPRARQERPDGRRFLHARSCTSISSARSCATRPPRPSCRHNTPNGRRRARRDHPHLVGRRLRRTDRPGRVLGHQGRGRRHDAAHRARARDVRHPRLSLAPGIFGTPMLGAMPQEVQDSLGKQVPFPPRLGKPEEFAALVQTIFESALSQWRNHPARWRHPHAAEMNA